MFASTDSIADSTEAWAQCRSSLLRYKSRRTVGAQPAFRVPSSHAVASLLQREPDGARIQEDLSWPPLLKAKGRGLASRTRRSSLPAMQSTLRSQASAKGAQTRVSGVVSSLETSWPPLRVKLAKKEVEEPALAVSLNETSASLANFQAEMNKEAVHTRMMRESEHFGGNKAGFV